MNNAQLIDTHCHLYSEEFLDDRTAMIQRAIDEGVGRFFLPNIDKSSIDGMLELEEEFPEDATHDGPSSLLCEKMLMIN
jgi:Tat protein secretion system quality control protein TatD with DNase activity